MTRKSSQNKKNAANFSPQSEPQNGSQNPTNALDDAVELTALPQNVRITAQLKPKQQQQTQRPVDPSDSRRNGRNDEPDDEVYDAADLPGIFHDVFADYTGDTLQCVVSKYTNPERTSKKAYSTQFPFNPDTCLVQLQDLHPEGGTFKLRIHNSDLSVDDEYDRIEILPSVQYRRPSPPQQQQTPPQPAVDPMAFMKPMIEMQTMAFTQMQMMMQASNAMMTGLMTQMETMNKLRPEPPDALAMIDKVVNVFGKVKEAQGSIGGNTDTGNGRGEPYTGMDILYNFLDKPTIAERAVNIVEKIVGIDQTANPRYDAEAEVIPDDDEEQGTAQREIETKESPKKETLTMQQEYDITFMRAVTDWQNNADPKPSAIGVKRFLKKHANDEQFKQFPMLFALTPAQAFEAIKGKLLLPEMHDKIRALPHHLDWFQKFLEIVK